MRLTRRHALRGATVLGATPLFGARAQSCGDSQRPYSDGSATTPCAPCCANAVDRSRRRSCRAIIRRRSVRSAGLLLGRHASIMDPSREFSFGMTRSDHGWLDAGGPVAEEPKVRFRPPSWLCSTLGRESDPNQTTPRADAFVFGDEVTRWFSLELQPRHHSL